MNEAAVVGLAVIAALMLSWLVGAWKRRQDD